MSKLASPSLMPLRLHPVRLAIAELAGLGLGFGAPTVHAQADTARNEPPTQSIVVSTGNRGATRTVAKSLSPIDVIGAEELAKSGKQNLREALEALAPSYTETAGFKGQIGLAVNTATLRGLSGTDVLVLVNGKRRHISSLIIAGLGPAGTDLDFIPTGSVARVEILRDGAAAQYGSDAIAGVINIILKSDAKGGSASLVGSRYFSSVGDQGLHGTTGNLQVNQGLALGDGGFLNLSASYVDQQATNVAGPVPRDGEPGARRIYFPLTGTPDPRETSLSRFRQILGRPASKTYNLEANAQVPVSADVSAYAFATVGNRKAHGWGTFRTANAQQNILSVYPDGFLPEFNVWEDDYQATGGAKGVDLAGWDWDVSTSYGHNDGNSRNQNTINPTLGPTSPHDFDNGHLILNEWTTDLDATREVATGFFDKPLGVSAGVEFRRTVFKQTPGQFESYADGPYVFPAGGPWAGVKPNPGAAGFAGYSPAVSGSYARTNKALYLDLSQRVARGWDVSAAVRHERYSDVGSTTSGKLSSRYEVTPQFAVRGTVNNGFAAPTLQQQHFTNVLGAYSTNPVTGQLSQSFTRSVPTDDAAAKALGAKPLTPEKSKNLSLGLVWQPARDTTVSVDAYQLDIDDRIVQSSTLQSVQTAPVLAAAGLSTNQNVSFFLNAGDTRTRGVDVVADHTQRLADWGRIKWTLLVNQIETKIRRLEDQPAQLAGTSAALVGRDTVGRLTVAYPKNTTSLAGTWTFRDVDTTLKLTRYSSVKGLNQISPLRDEYVKAAFIVNLNVGWQATRAWRFSVGANNLFDKRPEQLNDEAVKFYGFPVGRPNYSWYSPYGVDGGFYYARADLAW